jgi:hypothetical protein
LRKVIFWWLLLKMVLDVIGVPMLWEKLPLPNGIRKIKNGNWCYKIGDIGEVRSQESGVRSQESGGRRKKEEGRSSGVQEFF